ncbi:hypothetical protein ILYODFUR_021094 [Ilyodon furcidens]|uniref:Secreted protein n=1 Tax=Ilyodon furcidens TaxID=33524 RepID=A0ABV0TPJ5_9TELE
MSKLCQKCQHFVWPPLFSSTALTLLGIEFTRGSQVVTGILLHDNIIELEDVGAITTFRFRMHHRCSIGYRSEDMLGQSSPLTPSFFSRAVSPWRCVWGVIMMEYCPAAHFSKRLDHALLHTVLLYSL